MEPISVLSLIGSLGSAAAAVFVCWFLVTSFLKRQQEQQECMTRCNEQLLALAKDKGEVLRANAVAMERFTGTLDRMISILEKIEHDVPPGELVSQNTAAIGRLERATTSLVSGLHFAAEHLPPSAVVVPATAIEIGGPPKETHP